MNKKKITKVLVATVTVGALGLGFMAQRGQTGQIDPPVGFNQGVETRGVTGPIDPPVGFIIPGLK